jgi:TolB protein
VRIGASPQRLTTDGHNGADGLTATPQGEIIYAVGENEQSQLWRMSSGGRGPQRLVQNAGFLPSASKEGHIAYVSREGGGHHIWIVDSDGQNNRQLTFGDGESYPSITPDGSAVVYVSRAKDRGTIWKISTVGGQPVQITFGGIILRPVISPDGTKIACTYRTDESDRWKIAVLPFDGGAPLSTFALPYPYNQIIRWSPDSKALTYLDKANGVHNLWRQPIDGSAPTQLTFFDSDLIMHYGWLSAEELILARGGRRRDIVLIKNFDAAQPSV